MSEKRLADITDSKERVAWLLAYCLAQHNHGKVFAGCMVKAQDAAAIQTWAKQLIGIDVSVPTLANGGPRRRIHLSAEFVSRLAAEKCGSGPDGRFMESWREASAAAAKYRNDPAPEPLDIMSQHLAYLETCMIVVRPSYEKPGYEVVILIGPKLRSSCHERETLAETARRKALSPAGQDEEGEAKEREWKRKLHEARDADQRKAGSVKPAIDPNLPMVFRGWSAYPPGTPIDEILPHISLTNPTNKSTTPYTLAAGASANLIFLEIRFAKAKRDGRSTAPSAFLQLSKDVEEERSKGGGAPPTDQRSFRERLFDHFPQHREEFGRPDERAKWGLPPKKSSLPPAKYESGSVADFLSRPPPTDADDMIISEEEKGEVEEKGKGKVEKGKVEEKEKEREKGKGKIEEKEKEREKEKVGDTRSLKEQICEQNFGFTKEEFAWHAEHGDDAETTDRKNAEREEELRARAKPLRDTFSLCGVTQDDITRSVAPLGTYYAFADGSYRSTMTPEEIKQKVAEYNRRLAKANAEWKPPITPKEFWDAFLR